MLNRRSFLNFNQYSPAIFLACMVIAACGKAESHSPVDATRFAPQGWQTVCMGRMLLELPPETQFAASDLNLSGVYRFDGIGNVQAWGAIKWGNVKFSETVPTNRTGLTRVANSAQRDLLSPEDMSSAITEGRAEIEKWKKATNAVKDPDQKAAYQKITLEKEEMFKELLTSSKVSGMAQSVKINEFAVRPSADQYVVGFLDQKDNRVRIFSGDSTDIKNNSTDEAIKELHRWQSVYETRPPTEIPSKPGYCSSFGFFNEGNGPDVNAEMKIPFRLKQYPNLLFYLEAKPSETPASASIYDFPDMAVSRAHLDVIGIKHRHGPSKVLILGTPGRIYAQEYGPNCASKNDCRPADQAYEIHAETLGEVGRVDRPHLTLYMVAATSDEYKAKRKPSPGEPSYNTPARPALRGHEPPPFSRGYEIFEQVLHSIRIRPGAIANQ